MKNCSIFFFFGQQMNIWYTQRFVKMWNYTSRAGNRRRVSYNDDDWEWRSLHFVRVSSSGKNFQESKLDSSCLTRRVRRFCSFTRILSPISFHRPLPDAPKMGKRPPFSPRCDSPEIKVIREEKFTGVRPIPISFASREPSIDLTRVKRNLRRHI